MSINDPILEALSFTLENDLSVFTTPSPSTSNPSSSSKRLSGEEEHVHLRSLHPDKRQALSQQSHQHECTFVESSVLLGEDQAPLCPLPTCAFTLSLNLSLDSKARSVLLAHLLTEHQLVIEKPEEIANWSRYLNYWRERFSKGPITDFCVGFAMEETPLPSKSPRNPRKKGRAPDSRLPEEVEAVSQRNGQEGQERRKEKPLYYMLSPALPEDNQLRKDLWKKRLNIVLEVNHREREETSFSRRCLFCREVIGDNRSDYFAHMRDSHSFHIGLADNLVFVKELLQLIEEKLNRLECLFCEHIFKDKPVLKEHMRKKQHRKLNPKNQEYDRYYLVNYLEPGKTWETMQLEDAEDERREDEWIEPSDEKERNVVCLFCSTSESNFQLVLEHLKSTHRFDFQALTSKLDFYQKVKFVNYIRRTVYQNSCFSCEKRFGERTLLLQHIHEHNIVESVQLLPDAHHWNQSEYLLPTYENDDFLTFLDGENANEDDAGVDSNVIPEDMPPIDINKKFDLAGFAIRFHNQTK